MFQRLTLLLLLAATWGVAADPAPTTWCNPLSIPNYPLGLPAQKVKLNPPQPQDHPTWLVPHKVPFRELADPTALWYEGAWYLYPSGDMAWVSRDRGATWEHHPIESKARGYAPTAVRHRGKFYLLASGSQLEVSDGPLGPFKAIGKISLPKINGMPGPTDPMLMSDDDGRLFFYWGCSAILGIWGVELDPANPTTVIGTPCQLVAFDPKSKPWERYGEWNEDPSWGYLEGCWVVKYRGTYYLTWSAAGTQFRTYAMGCATSTSPLGPFIPQAHNPILRTTDGLVTGTGHGCIVVGPEDQLWCFYTMRAGVVHGFERRLGMDRATIDAQGQMVVLGGTSSPRLLRGTEQDPGWVRLNGEAPVSVSSCAANLQPRFIGDEDLRTWWQPTVEDPQPTVTSMLIKPATIRAVRVVWRDVGYDPLAGVKAGPFRYRVEAATGPDTWTCLIDRSTSDTDLMIDYRECPPTVAGRVRLVVLGWPTGITPAVLDFSVFGTPR